MDACRVQSGNASDVADVRHVSAKTVDRPPPDQAKSGSTEGAGLTVRDWGASWLSRREREGIRSIADDRARWRVHVECEAWIDLPLSAVTRALARDWLSRMGAKSSSNPTHKKRATLIAAGTIKNTLNLVRRAFQDAIEDGALEGINPFAGLRVRRSRQARTSEAWTVLTLDEQQRAILALGDLSERLLVQFAIGSGLRQGEQWSLRLADVHLDAPVPHVLVRFGRCSLEKPRGAILAERIDRAWFVSTKGGKPRKVPLFGVALAALRQWLLILKRYAPRNPHGLAFPRSDGRPRMKGRAFRAFSRVSTCVGRSVRWHDLRHTCASSLVGGLWGPPWSLEEVRVFLGHATIVQTERYAHFAPERLNRAAARTLGVASRMLEPPQAGPFLEAWKLERTKGSEGVTTMVDANESSELEESKSAANGAGDGRFSSEVEQRFRNPEAGSETQKTDATAATAGEEPPSSGLTPRESLELLSAQARAHTRALEATNQRRASLLAAIHSAAPFEAGARVRIVGGAWTGTVGKLATVRACSDQTVTLEVDGQPGTLTTAIGNVQGGPHADSGKTRCDRRDDESGRLVHARAGGERGSGADGSGHGGGASRERARSHALHGNSGPASRPEVVGGEALIGGPIEAPQADVTQRDRWQARAFAEANPQPTEGAMARALAAARLYGAKGGEALTRDAVTAALAEQRASFVRWLLWYANNCGGVSELTEAAEALAHCEDVYDPGPKEREEVRAALAALANPSAASSSLSLGIVMQKAGDARPFLTFASEDERDRASRLLRDAERLTPLYESDDDQAHAEAECAVYAAALAYGRVRAGLRAESTEATGASEAGKRLAWAVLGVDASKLADDLPAAHDPSGIVCANCKRDMCPGSPRWGGRCTAALEAQGPAGRSWRDPGYLPEDRPERDPGDLPDDRAPAIDERAPDMATAAAAVAERDALPFGERATSRGLEDDDLSARHRRAVGLLSDAVKALHAAESFLNEEVRKS